jgi:hypothetical protein
MKPIHSLTAACAALAAAAAAFAAVPPTEVTEVRDPMHGVEIVDPYRWLEGSDAPEITGDAELDARVSAWTDAQNAYTREVLDELPGRAALESRLRELMEVAAVASPAVRGNPAARPSGRSTCRRAWTGSPGSFSTPMHWTRAG